MNVEIQRQFREIVAERLAELGWSRSDLARELGKRPQEVTNVLNGHQNPGPDMMMAFLKALGLKPVLTVVPLERTARKTPLQTAG